MIKWLYPWGLLLIGVMGTPALAQTSSTETLTLQPRLGLRYSTEGPGAQAVTNLEGFLPLTETVTNSLPFLEGRLFLDTTEHLSGGLTLGYRTYNHHLSQIFGGYIAYDGRNTGKSTFEQLGAGLELINPGWEARINGYFPVGDRRNQTFQSINSTPLFSGNQLVANRSRQYEASIGGFDAEIGTKILGWEGGALRGYGGVYYYGVEGRNDVLGWRARLEARPTPYSSIGLTLQHDDLFDTRLMLSIGVNFPATRRGKGDSERAIARLGDTVQRQSVIPVDTQVVNDTIALSNTRTGQPFKIWHVTLGSGTATGSFESPFNNLEQALAVAQAGDIIYVNAGNNSGINPFTIANDLQVLSSGPVQTVNTLEFGTLQLPGSGSGLYPLVRGTVGAGNAVITLGSNTVLSGFEVQVLDGSTSGDGVRGIMARNASNVDIRENRVSNAIGEGIYLNNVTGTAKVTNNTITNTRHNNNSGFSELNGAILVNNSVGGLNLTIANNTIENTVPLSTTYDVDGIEFSLCRTGVAGVYPGCTGTATATVVVQNNTIINRSTVSVAGADGIDFNLASMANLNTVISGNIIQNISDRGISFSGEGNAIIASAEISNNQVSNVNDNGIHIRPRGSSRFNFMSINNNILTGTFGGTGIDVRMDDDSGLLPSNSANATISITNNQLLGNFANSGIRLRQQQDAVGNFTVMSNQITLTTASGTTRGIDVETQNTAALQLLLDRNQISGSRGEGIRIRSGTASGSTSRVVAIVRNNTVTSNNTGTNPGFLGNSQHNSTLCLRIENNTTSNTGTLDFNLTRVTTSTLQLFGISTEIAVVNPSPPLQMALTALGNIGRNQARVQTATVQVPTSTCSSSF